jgi:maleylpyruvate isomerase
MILHGYWRSSCSWRVRIALAYKGIAYEPRAVHLLRDGGEQRADEYRAKNPMAQVPLLEVEEGGRTHRIAQSLAIIEYLEERQPEPTLYPGDAFARARARQIAEIVNAGIQPLQNLSVLQHLKHQLAVDEQAWARHFVARGLEALEAAVAEAASAEGAQAGRFAVGDAVSVADVCIVPQIYNATRFGIDLASYPTLRRIDAACNELPAFAESHPDRQPDRVGGT